MKRFAIRLISFAVFSTIFFVVINAVFLGIIRKSDFDLRKRIQEIEFDNPDFELLVIGASTSQDAFDAALLNSYGVKSYNMAIGGTTVKSNYIQLTEYLIRYSQRPKIVFLGLNSAMVKSFDEDGIHPIIETTMIDHKYTIHDVPILKFRWLGVEFLKTVVSKRQRNARLSHGQVKLKKVVVDDTPPGQSELDPNLFESSYWIGEIAKVCENHDIELLVVELPGCNEIRNQSDMGPYDLKFSNGSFAKLYNPNSHDFCKLFDPEMDWAGNSHLNEMGAIKFTVAFMKSLKILDENIEE